MQNNFKENLTNSCLGTSTGSTVLKNILFGHINDACDIRFFAPVKQELYITARTAKFQSDIHT